MASGFKRYKGRGKNMTQNDQILRHLKTHKRGITQLAAIEKYGCLRLSARIADLRGMGYDIRSEIIAVKNRDGETCHVARYTLV